MIIIIFIWSDEDIEKLRLRDPKIFEKVYLKYKKNIFNYLILKSNNDKGIAEEVLSDTFYSALKSAPNLKNKDKILSWLLQIANRRFLDYLKKKYRDKDRFTEIKDDNYTTEMNVIDDIHEKEKVTMMKAAFENLKPKYKDLIEMKYIKKYSQKKISEILNKTVSSVESLLYRSREALKKEIKKIYGKMK